MQDETVPLEVRIKCNGCGESLRQNQRFCEHCGAESVVRIRETEAGPLIDVPGAPDHNLPVVYEARNMSLDLADRADPTQAIVSLLPFVLPEARPAVSEALIAREKDLRSKARKADNASAIAGTFGASVGASVFSGAAVAAASAPISIPVILLGAFGLFAFGLGMMIHVEAKGERDDYNDHADTLASARQRYTNEQ